MSARMTEGAWHGKSPDRYTTRGAEVFHLPGGWFARSGNKVRGPLSSLPVALEAADRMLDEAAKAGTSA